jgi:hypothetical protein
MLLLVSHFRIVKRANNKYFGDLPSSFHKKKKNLPDAKQLHEL